MTEMIEFHFIQLIYLKFFLIMRRRYVHFSKQLFSDEMKNEFASALSVGERKTLHDLSCHFALGLESHDLDRLRILTTSKQQGKKIELISIHLFRLNCSQTHFFF
jgi:hypothetical protein